MEMIKINFICFLFMSLASLTACSSSKANKDFLYFHNGKESTGEVQLKDPLIQPNDLLNIQIFSKTLNQEQAALFNIPNGSGTNTGGYQVNTQGTIDVPLVGSVEAAGLTREQLELALADKLTPYVKDPSVIVRFLQFKVNVLGEVQSPGTKSFETDGVTVIDAIGAAGDLTDNGNRKDIMVIRNEGNKRVYHSIDLSDRNLFGSSVYQLQQNDIVYVSANKNKIKALSANPVAQRNLQLGLTLISLATTIISVIAVLTK
jgi:polysaccharide export outer membrane protein